MDISNLYNNLCIINAIYHSAVLISIFGFQISNMYHFIIISVFGIVMNLYFWFEFSKQTNILNNQQIINPNQNEKQQNDTQNEKQQNDTQNEKQQNDTQNEKQQNDTQNEQPINQKEIVISLKPHTKFHPIVNPNSETFVLPHQTQVIIRNGFTFKLISNNLVYELGPIESKHNTLKDDCANFKINPKSITIKKGTPYVKDYETFTSSNKTSHDEYYCLALGTQITLPQGTIFNDGKNLIKLKSDTLVTVA